MLPQEVNFYRLCHYLPRLNQLKKEPVPFWSRVAVSQQHGIAVVSLSQHLLTETILSTDTQSMEIWAGESAHILQHMLLHNQGAHGS